MNDRKNFPKVLTLALASAGVACLVGLLLSSWFGDYGIGQIVPIPRRSFTAWMALEVSISDDGRLATKVTNDGNFVLVDLNKRERVWERSVKDKCVFSAKLDPSGRYLVYPWACGQVIVEEIETGHRDLYESPGGARAIHAVAISSGGYPVAFGTCGKGLYLVGRQNGLVETLLTPEPCDGQSSLITSLSFSRDSRFLAAGWDCVTRSAEADAFAKVERTWSWMAETPNAEAIDTLVWEIEGRRLFGAVKRECSLSYSEAAFSPVADAFVVSGVNSSTCMWDVSSGKILWGPADNGGYSTAFLMNGLYLMAIMPSGADPYPQLFLLSASTGKTVSSAQAGEDIMTNGRFAAARSNRFLVAHRTGRVDVYEVTPNHRMEKVWQF